MIVLKKNVLDYLVRKSYPMKFLPLFTMNGEFFQLLLDKKLEQYVMTRIIGVKLLLQSLVKSFMEIPIFIVIEQV